MKSINRFSTLPCEEPEQVIDVRTYKAHPVPLAKSSLPHHSTSTSLPFCPALSLVTLKGNEPVSVVTTKHNLRQIIARGVVVYGPERCERPKSDRSYYLTPEGTLITVFQYDCALYKFRGGVVSRISSDSVLFSLLMLTPMENRMSYTMVYSEPSDYQCTLSFPVMHKLTFVSGMNPRWNLPTITDRPYAFVCTGNITKSSVNAYLKTQHVVWAVRDTVYTVLYGPLLYERWTMIKDMTFAEALQWASEGGSRQGIYARLLHLGR